MASKRQTLRQRLGGRLSVTLEAREAGILRQLARAARKRPEEVLSRLLREAYLARVRTMKRRAGFGILPDPLSARAKKSKKTGTKKSGTKASSHRSSTPRKGGRKRRPPPLPKRRRGGG